MSISLGPRNITNSTGQQYLSKNLIEYINDCTEYVYSLDEFSQYLIWRYTIGSASVNTYLIFGDVGDNADFWCYLFFKYWNNTSLALGIRGLGNTKSKGWSKFRQYFINPKSIIGNKIVAKQVIINYILSLNYIINNSPPVKKPILVYKIASKYPGLPDSKKELPAKVFQLPFNSTTVNPYFNFGFFGNQNSVVFELELRPGNKALWVPSNLHAYPFEREIILPSSINFDIIDMGYVGVNFIDANSIDVTQIQKGEKIDLVMGPVYNINEFNPCKGRCVINTYPTLVYQGFITE